MAAPRVLPPSPFQTFAAAHGVTHLSHLNSKLGLGWSLTKRLYAGTMEPNHPHLQQIASALKVPVEQLAPFCNGKPMPASQVQRLGARLAQRASGRGKSKAVILHPTKSTRALAGRRNSLKRQALDLRDAVRGMLTTTNVAVMKGERYVPNIPTEALYLVLTDYAERRGIKTPVVLHPRFAELFD